MSSVSGLSTLSAGPQPTSAVHELRLASADRQGQEGGRQTRWIASGLELADGTRFNRAPEDLHSWELLATYRLAWHLASFRPSAKVAQPLADWLCMAQRELERRGEWHPEALPPQSM
jgi:hypothetical protein